MRILLWNVPENHYISMSKRFFRTIVPLAVAIAATACSGHSKLLKSQDRELMYQKALEYHEARKYEKSSDLIAEIEYYYMGTVREDTILYIKADNAYQQQDYFTSSMIFDDFRRRFGRSPFAEEAEYKYAMGFYYLSPPPNRDQTLTYQAITAMTEYMERYPDNVRKQLCLVRIDELQNQLYDKSLLNAKTYVKIGRYKSAVVALKNALAEYPATPHREEILYLTTKSSYELASNSVRAIQRDRYMDMMDTYYTFISEFPDSRYRKEVDRMHKTARSFLDTHPTDVIE